MKQRTILFIILFTAITSTVEARWKLIRRRGRPHRPTYSHPFKTSGTDQERAQQEADYMASRNIRGHVGSAIGKFEGVGWGSYNCGTCTPQHKMTLTADARAQSSSGTWYRVRAWR